MYAGKKLLQMLVTLFGVVTLVFFAMRLIPGDAASVMAGENLSGAALERMREQLGLNEPLWMQYLDFMGHLLRFDFGQTITTNLSISKLLLSALPITITIAVCTIVLAVLIAIPLGTLAAYMANKGKRWLDNALTWVAMVLDLMPSFWMALLLMLLFSLTLKWLPATGPIQFEELGVLLKRLALPIVILAIGQVATLARIARTSVLEVLNE
ncbi:MAG TPA: ABC transporter permease, partial [Paenibacillus sp.]|nr:ABC transporter permease [Paenibacillus sp.]